MTMLLPLFILVGFIAGYFVNAIAYHLSPLEDKTALTFRQVLVHFRQKKYAWHDTVPLILCVAAAIACALAPFTPIVTGALFLYFCFVLTLSVIDFRTQLLPDKLTLPLLWLGLVFNAQYGLIDLHDAVYGAVAGYGVLWCVYWGVWLVCHKEGLGYGDFKLLAAAGAWCGWQTLPMILLDCLAGWHWLRHRFTTSATPDYNHYRIRPVACARQHDKPGVSGLDLLLTGRVLPPDTAQPSSRICACR